MGGAPSNLKVHPLVRYYSLLIITEETLESLVVMEDDRILERERYQIEQIRELDLEELQVEEVDDLEDSSDDEATY